MACRSPAIVRSDEYLHQPYAHSLHSDNARINGEMGTGTIGVGVVVADPAQYAAAVADTPWPAFPVRLLAPPPGAAQLRGPVPVIASPGVVAAGRSAVTQLDVAGSRLAVRVAATAASTAGALILIMGGGGRPQRAGPPRGSRAAAA
jgi:hypothetical protein